MLEFQNSKIWNLHSTSTRPSYFFNSRVLLEIICESDHCNQIKEGLYNQILMSQAESPSIDALLFDLSIENQNAIQEKMDSMREDIRKGKVKYKLSIPKVFRNQKGA